MKYLDNFSKRILTVSLSIMGLMLCASLFMSTVGPAQAGTTSSYDNGFYSNDFPETSAGKIMMDYTSVYDSGQEKVFYECLVWNSVTGKSKLYFYSYLDKKFKPYEDKVQLPRYPLDD